MEHDVRDDEGERLARLRVARMCARWEAPDAVAMMDEPVFARVPCSMRRERRGRDIVRLAHQQCRSTQSGSSGRSL